jgi:GNAT superfamily N-acetyltransferase
MLLMDFDAARLCIRPATADDLPAVHSLVGELADFEQAADAFTATLDTYRRDFAAGLFEILVADYDGQVVGMAFYYLTYSTWKGRMLYLEDFVVREPFRRHGIGQQLFDAFLARARGLGCRLAKWQVLDWNRGAIDFYQRNGAAIEEEWLTGKVFLN